MPLLTWRGEEGLRAELSAVTFLTAVAKTAAALADWEVPPGATVRLDPRPDGPTRAIRATP